MLPSRTSARLPEHDYSTGMFFVTICAHRREQLFGSIRDGQMRCSPLGYLAADRWRFLERDFPNITLSESVVMPNHVHGLVYLRPRDGAGGCASLATLIAAYKSAVTREARRLGLHGSAPVWQSRFYDHCVRHERALERIRDYIANNPAHWTLDRENPGRSGEHQFYGWMESYSKAVAAPE